MVYSIDELRRHNEGKTLKNGEILFFNNSGRVHRVAVTAYNYSIGARGNIEQLTLKDLEYDHYRFNAYPPSDVTVKLPCEDLYFANPLIKVDPNKLLKEIL